MFMVVNLAGYLFLIGTTFVGCCHFIARSVGLKLPNLTRSISSSRYRMSTVDMAACAASDEDSNDCVRSTYESQVATYLSLREQNWQQLNMDLNAAASQAEKEKVFREYLANEKTVHLCQNCHMSRSQ